MATSSIRRACENLANIALPVFLDGMQDIADSAVLESIKWDSRSEYDGDKETATAKAYTSCVINHACMRTPDEVTKLPTGNPWNRRIFEGEEFGLPTVEMVKAWCSDFAVKNFGADKSVKTSNVSLKTILEGKPKTGDNGFPDWFYIQYESDYVENAKEIFRKKTQELIGQFRTQVASMDEQRTDALVKWAQRDIKRVLIRYRNVDSAKIQEAIQAAVVGMVLEF